MPRASETSSGPNFQSAVKWYVFFTFIVACFHLVHVPRRPVFQALICHIKKMNLKKCTIADRLAPLGQRSSWTTWATRVSCTALWPLQNTHNTYELQHIYRYIPIQFTTRGEWKKSCHHHWAFSQPQSIIPRPPQHQQLTGISSLKGWGDESIKVISSIQLRYLLCHTTDHSNLRKDSLSSPITK